MILCDKNFLYAKGFSLLELLLVIGIISIMYALVFPTYQSTSSRVSQQIIRSQLLRAIRLAQSEAITRQEVIFLEKTSAAWQQGFVVKTLQARLYTFTSRDQQGTLHWRAFPAHKENLEFMRNGMLQAENGTFWYCDLKQKQASWAIVVNKAGRAREVLPNKSGQIEIDRPLVCAS